MEKKEREIELREKNERRTVIIYRSRYHRLLVNRPHQGDEVKRDVEA